MTTGPVVTTVRGHLPSTMRHTSQIYQGFRRKVEGHCIWSIHYDLWDSMNLVPIYHGFIKLSTCTRNACVQTYVKRVWGHDPLWGILEMKRPEATPEMFPAITSLVPKPHLAFCCLQYAHGETLRSRLSQNMSLPHSLPHYVHAPLFLLSAPVDWFQDANEYRTGGHKSCVWSRGPIQPWCGLHLQGLPLWRSLCNPEWSFRLLQGQVYTHRIALFSLVPSSSPHVRERGSGVLSDLSQLSDLRAQIRLQNASLYAMT